MYPTSRGIEELGVRRGADPVTLAWLAGRLGAVVDLHPGFGIAWPGSLPGLPVSARGIRPGSLAFVALAPRRASAATEKGAWL